jgi:hypothetical protein
MIIVKDIQDAMTMKKKLSSLVRRSVNFNKDKKDILIELMLLIEELDRNVEREESLMEDQSFLESA